MQRGYGPALPVCGVDAAMHMIVTQRLEKAGYGWPLSLTGIWQALTRNPAGKGKHFLQDSPLCRAVPHYGTACGH
ncbi:hypothetical protein D3W54_15365 [Komagataeibacter medellinensis]|uniref:Transposase n=1 Tax=Komagataeibacter medellinensis TaxID=1177712 RepID=A0ABQ6VRH8_9PROT|nr:hypothetical protein D3W54_15365 [Komagataeibacter medellinensis]